MFPEVFKILSSPPGWLAWTCSLIISTIAGFVSGLIAQMVVPDLVGLRSMRRTLYRDLAQMYFAVDLIMNMDEPMRSAGQDDPLAWRQLKFRDFPFVGEGFYTANPAVYMQLRERFAIKALYQRLNYVLEQPPTSLPHNARSLAGVFALFVKEGVLKPKYFKRYLDREKARALLASVNGYNENRERELKRVLDQAASKQ
jgi:hypothetical protein